MPKHTVGIQLITNGNNSLYAPIIIFEEQNRHSGNTNYSKEYTCVSFMGRHYSLFRSLDSQDDDVSHQRRFLP